MTLQPINFGAMQIGVRKHQLKNQVPAKNSKSQNILMENFSSHFLFGSNIMIPNWQD